jgi:hypothetical protein
VYLNTRARSADRRCGPFLFGGTAIIADAEQFDHFPLVGSAIQHLSVAVEHLDDLMDNLGLTKDGWWSSRQTAQEIGGTTTQYHMPRKHMPP